MESLRDKLELLGVQIGAKNIRPRPVSHKKIPVEELMDGYEHSSINGNTYIAMQTCPRDYRHGKINIFREWNKEKISLWSGHREFSNLANEKIAFLDTETSGLSSGAGTVVFMVGVGYFTEGEFTVSQLFLRSPAQETAFLEAFLEVIDPFSAVVTYNGKSFDIPMLNSRLNFHKMPSPFKSIIHLDLLHLARKIWKYRLPQRRLADLEHEIMVFERTEKEVPGWMVPQIYYDYLLSRDARPLDGVFYHNFADITSLAALLTHMSVLLEIDQVSADIDVLELVAIARIYEELGLTKESERQFKKCLAQNMPAADYLNTLLFYANMLKRKGDLPSATELWDKAAEVGSIDACVELAKYFEHKVKNQEAAEKWTRRGMILTNTHSRKEKRDMYSLQLNHRLDRILRKTKQN
jgi:uncharacterized protein